MGAVACLGVAVVSCARQIVSAVVGVAALTRGFIANARGAEIAVVTDRGLKFALPGGLVAGPDLTGQYRHAGDRLVGAARLGITGVRGAGIVVRTHHFLVDTETVRVT
jgi:hypothetical protein